MICWDVLGSFRDPFWDLFRFGFRLQEGGLGFPLRRGSLKGKASQIWLRFRLQEGGDWLRFGLVSSSGEGPPEGETWYVDLAFFFVFFEFR